MDVFRPYRPSVPSAPRRTFTLFLSCDENARLTAALALSDERSLSLSLSLFLAWEIFRFDSPAVPISGRIQPATCV
jgi:hypothetical protein